MINLSRHIEYQLLYHDTVVVPQLGTFKATYVPSKWIEEEELLLPPYRALTFTQQVDETDTRFVETVSASYQISTDEAYIITLEFTENIQQELTEYGSYELGSIGEFVQEEETGNIQFIPCQAGVASPGLYGLDAIHVQPVVPYINPEQNQTDKKMSINTDARNVTISINKHILNYVAAVAASLVLFFAFSTPVSDNMLTRQQASSSECLFPTNLIVLPQPKTTQSTETTTNGIATENPKNETMATRQTEKNSPTFSVVLCCGVPVQNAKVYCEDLNKRGINAVIDDSSKVLRILIPGYVSKEEALNKVRSLRSQSKEFANAWILEK